MYMIIFYIICTKVCLFWRDTPKITSYLNKNSKIFTLAPRSCFETIFRHENQ